ncbi:Glycosyl transferases group 1 [Mucilaginibacter mallensis]|uniref:Glycosyl transferases group 1 n=1 Tax=Mucilaginibacter mallensis TaxID=652787 RepID=A0A1H1WTA6_MUCMA|nr:glycosyltransferase [Mucilaginibacter mallensis]SDS99850.1 Glycosyl transferases group 1 [Mucilaginibacter mallensis]
MKKKILISAYAISPVKGSEYGAAWDTVTQLAKHHELWVLYGMSDDHMGDTQTLREFIKTNPLPSVTFIEVRAGKVAMAINRLNKIGLGWFFYIAYYLWQQEALKVAYNVLATVNIDVVHQLGPIGFREPGFLGYLDKPLVWGPIGGMKMIDSLLLEDKPLPTRFKFWVKHQINHFQLHYSQRISEAFSRADILIAATIDGQQTILKRFGRESHWLPEQAIVGDIEIDETKFDHIHQRVQLVWSGSHIERKNLGLCLDSLALIKHNNWHLHILGSGPLTGKLKQKADELGLSANITWHGQLSRSAAINIMNAAHLHMMTSIAEDNPAVIFEALRLGVPTLTLNHCGMGDVLCNNCGIKIMVATHDQMAGEIATVLDHFLLRPEILADMALGTISCATRHHWEKRLTLMNAYYDEAIALHGKSRLSNNETLIILQNA